MNPNHDWITDTLLVNRCCAGDEAAFFALYARHAPRTSRVLTKFAGDADELADLVQETWIIIFRALPRFRGACKFTSWVHRIALNNGYSHVRRKKPRCEFNGPSAIASPEDALLMGITLDGRMALLPSRMRTVMHLVSQGYRHDDVARMLHIDCGTSKSQLSKARSKMRGLLRDVVY